MDGCIDFAHLLDERNLEIQSGGVRSDHISKHRHDGGFLFVDAVQAAGGGICKDENEDQDSEDRQRAVAVLFFLLILLLPGFLVDIRGGPVFFRHHILQFVRYIDFHDLALTPFFLRSRVSVSYYIRNGRIFLKNQ